MKDNKRRIWIIILFVLIALVFLLFFGIISLFVNIDSTKLPGNVALIKINGVIVSDKEKGDFFSETLSSSEIVKLVEKAASNSNIKAIVFEINSPGGSAVASDEIGEAIKSSNKPTVAWIREVGASGGYWVASATDHIIANRMSITGSIGVIASYLDFSGFIQRYNISYQRLVSGRYKDIGSPFKTLEFDEKLLFQERLDALRGFFIDQVAANRNLSHEEVEELATGLFYLGYEAKDLGLVDELGSKKEVLAYLEKKIGEKPEIIEYKQDSTLWDVFGDVLNKNSFHVGEGIGNAFFNKNRASEFNLLS